MSVMSIDIKLWPYITVIPSWRWYGAPCRCT